MKPACLSRQQLQEYSLGYLDDDQQSRVEQHLLECHDCDETLMSLDDVTDSLLRHVRQVPEHVSSTSQSELRHAMRRIEQIDMVELAGADAPDDRCHDDALPELQTDKQLRDYQLSRVIGRGGMGTVYEGLHERLQMPVAIKVLPERRMRDAASVLRFEREMRAIGKLDHPSIVRATDAGEVDGTHFLAMELIHGVDLGRLLKTVGPLEAADAVEIIRQACLGIQHAHEIGIVHRDIKPSNLMLTDQGQIKILDLGLAMLAGPGTQVDEQTTVGQLMGTLDYMAPEQAGDGRDVTVQADIYALGASLYKLLCGHAPYGGTKYATPLQKLKAIGHDAIEPLESRGIDVPAGLADAVHKSLALDPQDRYQSAAEFAAVLATFAAGHDLAGLCCSSRSQCDADRNRELVSAANQRGTEIPLSVKTPATIPPTSLVQDDFRSGNWLRWLVTAAAAAALVWAATIIYLETGRGVLVIESATDDVTVTIKRANKVYEKVELKQGLNTTRLSAGSYEIEINGETDTLVVDKGSFTLKRGGNWIARIREVTGATVTATQANPAEATGSDAHLPKDVAPQGERDLPLYSGKNILGWLQTYDNPGPTEQGKALQAITILSKQPSSEPIILRDLQRRFQQAKNELNTETLAKIALNIVFIAGEKHAATAVDYLFEMASIDPDYEFADFDTYHMRKADLDAYFLAGSLFALPRFNDALAERVIKELENGSSARRKLALCIVRPDGYPLSAKRMRAWDRENRGRLRNAVATALNDADLFVREAAMLVMLGLDQEQPQFREQLAAIVRDDTQPKNIAMEFLVEVAVESDLVAEWARSEDSNKVFTVLNRIHFLASNQRPQANAAALLTGLLKDGTWGREMTRPAGKLAWGTTSASKRESARVFVITTLGELKTVAGSAISVLEIERQHADRDISRAAENAIKQIENARTGFGAADAAEF